MMTGTNMLRGDCHINQRLRSHLEYELGFNLDHIRLEETLNLLACDGGSGSFDQLASQVASAIAVHETYFLRHREQFNWIEEVWLPQVMLHKQPGDTIRLFSGGCATGEEPYSLYAHLAPKLATQGLALQVVAVDISEMALTKARQGRYGLWSLRGVTPEQEKDWLCVEGRLVEVQEWVRQGVLFCRHNLLQAVQAEERYDLILCRNVMIYMHQLAINRILCNLQAILLPDGFIVPGPSDPNPPPNVPLDVHWYKGCRVFVQQGRVLPDQTMQQKPVSLLGHGVDVMRPVSVSVKKRDACMEDIDMLIRNGRYDDARSLLEDNVRHNPLDVRSYITLCLMALDLDDLMLAEQSARRAAYLEPDALFTIYLIGNVKLRQGNADSAYSEFMWVWQHLRGMIGHEPVKYCEEISVDQFREVVRARING